MVNAKDGIDDCLLQRTEQCRKRVGDQEGEIQVKCLRIGIVAAMCAVASVSNAQVSEYDCIYRWESKNEVHPVQIKIDGQKATVRSRHRVVQLDRPFVVVRDDMRELILAESVMKADDEDYPAGTTLIVLDRLTLRAVLSNTFVDASFNRFAYGQCKAVRYKP